MKPLINQNFRYTFPKKTLTNISNLQDGLYTYMFKNKQLVFDIDKFGELRLSNETPVNNHNSLLKCINKQIKG